jgi:hypothetical protein
MTEEQKIERVNSDAQIKLTTDENDDLQQIRLKVLAELSALDQENGFYSINEENIKSEDQKLNQCSPSND